MNAKQLAQVADQFHGFCAPNPPRSTREIATFYLRECEERAKLGLYCHQFTVKSIDVRASFLATMLVEEFGLKVELIGNDFSSVVAFHCTWPSIFNNANCEHT